MLTWKMERPFLLLIDVRLIVMDVDRLTQYDPIYMKHIDQSLVDPRKKDFNQ